ncbi:hypothetical protein JEQ12_000383 [Ovis aries]|uniref:Helically-extended SH3 domain-containing protein n=1 Tax=Ovis aries TaxID=9940 RepID=A0A836D9M8_SHEEP|nr:hypothetical protein JEQ12_000383 [Ovis aries]
MEAGPRPAAGESAPTPAEGGAAAQVGQVGSLGSGVSAAAARGSDCSLAGAGRAEQTLGLRIQLWETGFVFQTLSRKKVMEAKLHGLGPNLLEAINKIKWENGSKPNVLQNMEQEGLRNFKELRAKFQNLDASSLSGPIKFPAGVSRKGDFGSRQSMKTLASGKPPSSSHNQHSPNCADGDLQPLKPQQVKETQKSETQKCSNYLELLSFPSSAVSSQKAPLLLDVCQSNDEIANKKKVMVNDSFRNKLWSWEILSQKSETPSVFLPASCGSRAFHLKEQKSIKLTPEEPREDMEIKEAQSLPSHRQLMAQRRLYAISEDPTVRPSQCSRESRANSSPERSLTGSICHPVYDNKLTSQTPEEQPDVRHPQLPSTKPLPSVESLGPPPPKPPRPPVVTLQAFQRQAAALSKPDGEEAAKEGNLPPVRLARVFTIKNLGGYVKALEMTKETQGQGAIKPNSVSENDDDVECSGSRSSDGKASLKRLQKFFKKEKGRFKVKKINSKENISDELKGKSWKPKFLMLKEKKKKDAKESERSFFKTKKQNLEKDRMKREERLFRERFKYDKEITVINTAVVCSNNSRNGICDLPITPGEELDVIDITEENLVICRNSEGKCNKSGHLREIKIKQYGLLECELVLRSQPCFTLVYVASMRQWNLRKFSLKEKSSTFGCWFHC